MLEGAKEKVSQLENKIQSNKRKNNQSNDLHLIVQELKDYEKVASTLIKKLDGIDTNLNKEKDTNDLFTTVSPLAIFSTSSGRKKSSRSGTKRTSRYLMRSKTCSRRSKH